MTNARTARLRRQDARSPARSKGAPRRLLTVGLPVLAIAVVAIVAVVVSQGGSASPDTTGASSVRAAGPARSTAFAAGDVIPEFSARGLGGETVAWTDYRGTPTVLSVWAPWCPHCQKELPILDRILKDYPTVKVVSVVTAVGYHPGPTPEGFMADHGLSFPVAVDDATGTIAGSLGVTGFPTVYYVAADGTVSTTVVGETSEAAMRAALDKIARV